MLPAADWKRVEVFLSEVTRGRVGPNPRLRERRLLLIDNLFEGLALPAQAVWSAPAKNEADRSSTNHVVLGTYTCVVNVVPQHQFTTK